MMPVASAFVLPLPELVVVVFTTWLGILEGPFAIEHVNVLRQLGAACGIIAGGKEGGALRGKCRAVYLGAFGLGDEQRAARDPVFLYHPCRIRKQKRSSRMSPDNNPPIAKKTATPNGL